jgi:hypothetical protein
MSVVVSVEATWLGLGLEGVALWCIYSVAVVRRKSEKLPAGEVAYTS